MKTFLLLMLFPMLTWALTDIQVDEFKFEKTHMSAAACHDDSFLRGCFKISQPDCKTVVKTSFDGCYKFLKTHADVKQLTAQTWQKKMESCVLRDIAHNRKEKSDRRPACALPPQEAL
ncbi:MAG: hypothetical protein ACXVAX_01165 [Pseudobdellovibrio sp.]